jgi:hypothetical protein
VAVAADELGVMEVCRRVGDVDLDETLGRDASSLGGEEGVASAEAAGLVPRDGKAEPDLEQAVGVIDVVTPVAVALLQAQARQRLEPDPAQSEGLARAQKYVVDVGGHLRRDGEFIAEFPDVSDPGAGGHGIPEVDRADAPEAQGSVADIGVRCRGEDFARAWTLKAEHRQARGDVGRGRLPPARRDLPIKE